jgi:predicted outer membrane repeat protein
LIVSYSTFANNWAELHGGAIASNGGTVEVNDSTFSGNSAGDLGGAVSSLLGTVRVNRSTFVGNQAGIYGGALYLFKTFPFVIANSTISGNAGGAGGGIYSTGVGDIFTTTIVSNHGIGLFNGDGGATLFLVNSLLAGNAGGDCTTIGDLAPVGANLIGDGSCNLAGALTGNPMLGPLADNGGPTLTHALLPGSPAIDAGDGGMCATLPTDQRGSPRSVDGNLDGTAVCDLGAFEYSRLFDFSGFLAPVDNLPTVNAIKAGRAVPLTFSLSGDQGMAILAPGSPSSQRITCDSGAPVSEVEQTATPGASALSYDAPTDTYTYVWKTDKAWAGTCRQLVVQLADGTFHLASFRIN